MTPGLRIGDLRSALLGGPGRALAFSAPVGIGLAVTVTALVAPVVGLGVLTSWLHVLGDLAILSASVLATGACLHAARRGDGAARMWHLTAVGTGLWTLGMTVRTLLDLFASHDDPFPSLADIGLVGYALPAAAALLFLPRNGERLVSRMRVALDGLLISASVLFISWATVLGPIYSSDVTGLPRFVALAYPTVDITLVSLAFALGMRVQPGARRTWVLLGLGWLLLAVTDSVYVLLVSTGQTGLTETSLVVGWVLAFVLIAVAARTPFHRSPQEARRTFLVTQEVLPYLPVLAALVVLAQVDLFDGRHPFLLTVGTALAALLVLQLTTVTVEKVALANGLEATIAARTAELTDAASRNEMILDSAGDGIYGVDASGRITFINPRLAELVGYERQSLEGRDHHDALGHRLSTGSLVERADCPLCVAVGEEALGVGQACLRGRGDGDLPVEYVTHPMGSRHVGQGSVIVVRDMRERHALEDGRRRAEAERDRLASIVEASPDLVVIGRPDGTVAWMNTAGRTLLGLRSVEGGGYRIEDLFSPVEMARIYAEHMPVIAAEGRWQGVWTLQDHEATQIPVSVTAYLHHSQSGDDDYVSAIMRDLRPQLAEERDRRESERRLAAAEGVARLGSWEWDMVTNKVIWSPGMYRLHGMEPGDGQESFDAWAATVHEDDHHMAMEETGKARSDGGGVDFTYRAVLTDGRERVIHARGEVIERGHGEPTTSMLGTLLDITDRHAAAEALRASEERARNVIATAGDAYIQYDGHGVVTEWNDQAERTFGWSRGEAIGQQLSRLVIPPHEQSAYDRELANYARPDTARFTGERLEGHAVDRSGREFPVEITVWPIVGHQPPMAGSFVRDISERQAAERVKDEFVSVVGHELRTPLTSIHGALGLLRAGLLGDLNDRGQHMVDIAVHNTDRLVRLINDILDIERLNSGKVSLQRQGCDIAALANQSVDVMRPMADTAGVRLDIDAQLANVWADPDRIEQTLTNLISNAIKFSPAGATVWLVTRTDGTEVTVEVRDEGRGIPPEHLELVFDRFQQVDGSDAREKAGTGLGLAICRTIVEQHGGRIWAESSAGNGTTLTFTLPVVRQDEEADDDAGRRVLVCDGDASARDSVAAMLRSDGYEPVVLDLHGKAAEVALPDTADQLPQPIDADALAAAVDRAIDSKAVGPTLLLVNGEPDLADVLMERFEHLGIEVHHARTALAGVTPEQFERHVVALVDQVTRAAKEHAHA